MQGLIQAGDRKNLERMQEMIPDSDNQSLQHFITDSPWDAQEVMDEASIRASELIGDPKAACLIIDETSNTKKGHKSVGVARQYLGWVGKVYNGRVAVFTALCKGSHVALLHGQLNLPKEWVVDRARCIEAKVPL
jgi:SRSO17 transposase